MPIDLAPEELAELVTSDTRRRLLSGLDKLIMMDPAEPYEPRVTHLVIDIDALDDDIKNHFSSAKQIQDAAVRLREEHLPMFDRYGIVEYNRDEDRIRTTKSTMLFAAAIDEIEDAVDTDEMSGAFSADYAEEAAKAWLSTPTQGFS
jgi:AcrR family transcriptional regulator